jgi:hypothetical protein
MEIKTFIKRSYLCLKHFTSHICHKPYRWCRCANQHYKFCEFFSTMAFQQKSMLLTTKKLYLGKTTCTVEITCTVNSPICKQNVCRETVEGS